ncbi:autotransporter outer membrane beta-barrel domain-containing protein [Bartonella sp. LJL80]
MAQNLPCTLVNATEASCGGGTLLNPANSATSYDFYGNNSSLGKKLNDLNIVTVVMNGRGTGAKGHGLYLDEDVTITSGILDITVNGMAADGIQINRNRFVANIPNKLIIHANGYSSDAINITINTQATLNVGDYAELYSQSGSAARVNIGYNLDYPATLNIGKYAILETQGDGNNVSDAAGYGVYAGGRSNETNTAGSASMPLGNAPKISIGNGSQIITSGKDAFAVFANRTGVITLSSTNITTTGQGAHGIVTQDGDVVYQGVTNSFKGGQVYLTGDTNVSVDVTKGSYAMYSSGLESLIASQKPDGTLMPAKYAVTGDLIADRQGVIDLHMSDGSRLTGNANKELTAATAADRGVIKLDIDGASSHWQMWQSSNVTDLKLGHNAKASLGDQTIAVTNANKVTLSVDNLSGNGLFNLRTDMAPTALFGDLLEIRSSSAGSHQMVFTDNRTGGYTGTEELKVVDFIGTNQSDNNAVFSSAGADVGPYVYGLSQYADGNWYLSHKETPQPPVNPNPPPVTPPSPPVTPPLTNTADNSANFLNVNYYLGFIENQTLLQRMGELRRSPDKDGEVWMRSFGGGLDQFSGDRLSGFDMTYWGIQGGVDKRIELNNHAADLFVGLMGGYTKGDIDFKIGDGDAEQYHIGAYVTYKHQNGFYVDALAKYLHAENDFDTKTVNGYRVNGDGDMDGYALGAEIGQRFYKDRTSKLGLYVEPQVQLTWTHMGSGTISSSNGLRTKLGSYDSLLGRASAVFGYSLVNDGNPVDLYFKTGYLKEFDGDTDYTFNNTFVEKYSFDTGWWDNGIGMNVQVDKNKNLYMDANYAIGGTFNAWQLNAGYRQQF